MTRERDSQRAKVYAAERSAFHSFEVAALSKPEFKSLEDCRQFLHAVRRSAWYQRRYPGYPPIELRPGKGARNAFARSEAWSDSITLPLWARQRWVILHELSHVLQKDRSESAHGWQFCARYLELVYHELGEEAGDKLKAEFKSRGVKFKAPVKRAPLSEERKARLREQLARVRA